MCAISKHINIWFWTSKEVGVWKSSNFLFVCFVAAQTLWNLNFFPWWHSILSFGVWWVRVRCACSCVCVCVQRMGGTLPICRLAPVTALNPNWKHLWPSLPCYYIIFLLFRLLLSFPLTHSAAVWIRSTHHPYPASFEHFCDGISEFLEMKHGWSWAWNW